MIVKKRIIHLNYTIIIEKKIENNRMNIGIFWMNNINLGTRYIKGNSKMMYINLINIRLLKKIKL